MAVQRIDLTKLLKNVLNTDKAYLKIAMHYDEIENGDFQRIQVGIKYPHAKKRIAVVFGSQGEVKGIKHKFGGYNEAETTLKDLQTIFGIVAKSF